MAGRISDVVQHRGIDLAPPAAISRSALFADVSRSMSPWRHARIGTIHLRAPGTASPVDHSSSLGSAPAALPHRDAGRHRRVLPRRTRLIRPHSIRRLSRSDRLTRQKRLPYPSDRSLSDRKWKRRDRLQFRRTAFSPTSIQNHSFMSDLENPSSAALNLPQAGTAPSPRDSPIFASRWSP